MKKVLKLIKGRDIYFIHLATTLYAVVKSMTVWFLFLFILFVRIFIFRKPIYSSYHAFPPPQQLFNICQPIKGIQIIQCPNFNSTYFWNALSSQKQTFPILLLKHQSVSGFEIMKL